MLVLVNGISGAFNKGGSLDRTWWFKPIIYVSWSSTFLSFEDSPMARSLTNSHLLFASTVICKLRFLKTDSFFVEMSWGFWSKSLGITPSLYFSFFATLSSFYRFYTIELDLKLNCLPKVKLQPYWELTLFRWSSSNLLLKANDEFRHCPFICENI